MKTLILLLITTTFLSTLSSALILSNDDYAAGVVLNEPGIRCYIYNLDKLDKVVLQNNKYIAPSQYSSEIAAIFYQESGLTCGNGAGLAVRLQLPTQKENIEIPYIKIISYLPNTDLDFSYRNFVQGWDINCANLECKLEKPGTEITINEISKNRYGIVIESTAGLVSPSSGLRCFSKYGNSLCITNELKEDISSIISNISIAKDFNELLLSYNIISVGKIKTETLVPATTLKPDWKEAMRQELVNLRKKNVISMKDENIEAIVTLVQQGKAGKNSRIIYDDKIKAYNYYYKTSLPILTQEINTEPFSLPESIQTKTISNPYYYIPLIIGATLGGVLVILAILGRILTRQRKKKIKPTTALLAQE